MSSAVAGAGAPEKDVEHVEVAAAQPQPAKVEETTATAPAVAHVTAEVDEDLDDVPDPDEDDLDDLDGNKPQPATTTTAAPASPKPAAASAADEPEFSEDEFAKQLQAGMANLLEGFADTPEMQAQFESIFKELGAAASASADIASMPAAPPAPSGTSSTASPAPQPTEASFQDTIRRTMERMQTSGDQATAAAAAEGTDDFLAELLKQMGSGGGLEGGSGGEEEFSQMLMGMMEQLTNKEILYEPMKELHDKFPEWLDKNRDKTSAEDLARYETQRTLVRDIVGKFEEPTYSDANKADREYIVDRMQQMQASGSPPNDLVGDMPSAQDALNMPDEGCNPQ
ncbi:Pex19 protein family-domain-containing protein [Staphylotrichum tortipilum]|uniref:Pex19 protein family-domain-containing protein n=1 Tax=Staphylotrichum tortipilum TaxID=2831512 RepID=A0AAN6MMV2_9PEZI|nr:Pex19 protein family-domain-containing protein [Staphylotrichum longicolle]